MSSNSRDIQIEIHRFPPLWTLLRYINANLFFKLHLCIAYFEYIVILFRIFRICIITHCLMFNARHMVRHRFHKSTFLINKNKGN